MEHNAKAALRSATMPLLPVSYNPSNPYLSNSTTSRCLITKLVLLHRILLLAVALGFVTLLCVTMAISLVPEAPEIQLDSFFVSKLNISRTTVGANFDATFTIKNPNLVSWVHFNHMEGSISFKDNVLATYSTEPFVLGLKENRMMRLKISTTAGTSLQEDRLVVEEWVLDEINRQREDGGVSFSIEMFVWATYRNGWWGTQNVIMNPQCLDLRAGFLPKVGFGSWISGGPMTCSVPMLID